MTGLVTQRINAVTERHTGRQQRQVVGITSARCLRLGGTGWFSCGSGGHRFAAGDAYDTTGYVLTDALGLTLISVAVVGGGVGL